VRPTGQCECRRAPLGEAGVSGRDVVVCSIRHRRRWSAYGTEMRDASRPHQTLGRPGNHHRLVTERSDTRRTVAPPNRPVDAPLGTEVGGRPRLSRKCHLRPLRGCVGTPDGDCCGEPESVSSVTDCAMCSEDSSTLKSASGQWSRSTPTTVTGIAPNRPTHTAVRRVAPSSGFTRPVVFERRRPTVPSSRRERLGVNRINRRVTKQLSAVK
jgi:hypothetical protein